VSPLLGAVHGRFEHGSEGAQRVNGKSLVLGVIVMIVALWAALMFSLASNSPEEEYGGDCLSQENC